MIELKFSFATSLSLNIFIFSLHIYDLNLNCLIDEMLFYSYLQTSLLVAFKKKTNNFYTPFIDRRFIFDLFIDLKNKITNAINFYSKEQANIFQHSLFFYVLNR